MLHVPDRCNSRRAALLIALACGAFVVAAPTAAPADELASVTVAYGDLNLAAQEGNRALLARIRSAARQACFGYEVDSRDLRAVVSERVCENGAIEQALLKVCERAQVTGEYPSPPLAACAPQDAGATLEQTRLRASLDGHRQRGDDVATR